jgi:beta-lactamase class A
MEKVIFLMKKFPKILLTILLVIINLIIWYKVFIHNGPKSSVLSVNFEEKTSVTSSKTTPQASPVSSSLKEAIDKALEGSQGRYGIVVKNLKTGETFSKDEDGKFEAGSLYKLWVMTTVYSQVESGVLKEDQELSRSISYLNQKFSINPELAEQTEGGITLTVSEALNQMITISHNYAALLLTEKIRLSSVARFLKQNGFAESSVGTSGDAPITTPSDIALYFEKLYKGELGTMENTQKMLELLKKQTLNHKIPKNLPQGTVVAHKTGEIGWFTHDGGIVYSQKGDYIIVVLSESESPKGAEDRIADISKAVFDYLNQ